jgi:predicted RNA binding protein YcfA (HicA-like mRNA interferase family)
MPDDLPKLLSQATACKLLKANGWEQEIGGKHVVKMTKTGERPITLPACKGQDYSRGLTRAILKQAGLLPKAPGSGEGV